ENAMRRAASSRSISARSRRARPPPATGFRMTATRSASPMRRSAARGASRTETGAVPRSRMGWLRGSDSRAAGSIAAPGDLGDDFADDSRAEPAAHQVGMETTAVAQPSGVRRGPGGRAGTGCLLPCPAAPGLRGRAGEVELGDAILAEDLLHGPRSPL